MNRLATRVYRKTNKSDAENKECGCSSAVKGRNLSNKEYIKQAVRCKDDVFTEFARIKRRQIARLLKHLEESNRLNDQIKHDIMRSYEFCFEDLLDVLDRYIELVEKK